jgi:hypothetical protein
MKNGGGRVGGKGGGEMTPPKKRKMEKMKNGSVIF